MNNDIVLSELKIVVNELFNSDGTLISYSHELWNQLSAKLDRKLSAQNLFISVYQDRHSWQTILRNMTSKPLIINPSESGEESDDNVTSETDEGSDGATDGKIIFKVDIPYRDYVKMTPIQVKYGKKHNKKAFTVLKQGVWTNTINDYLLKTSKIDCNFIYKRCRVATNLTRSKHFLNFSGRCKECGAKLMGWADNKPDEAMPLNLNIIIENMNTALSHTSKRPLNGQKRQDIGTELFHDSASNWRRRAAESMQFGDKIPANLYNKSVLRKCKQDKKDSRLGITEKCPIISLIELKFSKYAGSIHLICAVPFIIHYWTPSQLVVYKSYRKSYVRLSIDATGSIVKKLKRTNQGILSSHIFLYEAVVSTGKFQASITQMLSEKQDTFTIYSWLNSWLMDGVRAPQETVCDYSMALLGGISRAFCGGISLHTYVDTCLDALKRQLTSHFMLTCYIRIDIAHLIKLVCRWKCWKKTRIVHLKEFYVRYVKFCCVKN